MCTTRIATQWQSKAKGLLTPLLPYYYSHSSSRKPYIQLPFSRQGHSQVLEKPLTPPAPGTRQVTGIPGLQTRRLSSKQMTKGMFMGL